MGRRPLVAGLETNTDLAEERIGARSHCAHWDRETTDPAEAP